MISILIYFSSSIRIARKEHTPLNYTHLDESQITNFIRSHKKSIIFYAENHKVLKPLKLTFEEYDDVAFGLVQPNPDTNKYCISYPCASAYQNGQHVRSTVSHFSPIDFEFWLSHTLSEPHFDIINSEELRRLLTLPGNSIFVVDQQNRPKFIPKTQVVYYTNSEFFSQLRYPLNPGTYLYRHADRELMAIDTWDLKNFETPLIDIGFSDLKQRPFFGGFFIDHSSDEADQARVDLTKLLAVESEKYFGLGVFADDIAAHVSKIGRMRAICGPLFAVFNSSDIKNNRYGVVDEDKLTSKTYLINWLASISRDDTKPERISQESNPSQDPNEVYNAVASDFDSYIFNNERTKNITVAIIYTSCNEIPPEFEILFYVVNQFYKTKGVSFVAFDQGRNDNPSSLPIFSYYPQILLWPKNAEKKKFYQYNDKLDLEGIVRFLRMVEIQTTSDEFLIMKRQFTKEIRDYEKSVQEAEDIENRHGDL